MYKIVLVFVGFLISHTILAFQVTDNTGGSLSYQGRPGSDVYEIRYITQNEGSKFLFDQNHSASIYANGSVYKKNINIDLEKNLVQFNKNGQPQYWELYKMDSIIVGNIRILPTIDKLNGCLIVYQQDGYNLINLKKAELKESNYNSALNVGSRNNKWTVKSTYYVSSVKTSIYYSKNENLVELPKSKKKFSKLFSSPNAILSFIKSEDINISEVTDLMVILDKFSNDLSLE